MMESLWYKMAKEQGLTVPQVFYKNEEMIVLQRVYGDKPTAGKICEILFNLRRCKNTIRTNNFQSYIDNIVFKVQNVRNFFINNELSKYNLIPSFFHGDFSTPNIIGHYLIDPGNQNIFGNWQTDAAKAMFSFLVYEKDLEGAKDIANWCGDKKLMWLLCAAEGSRVAKYNEKYNTFVNNILDIYDSMPTL